MLISILYAVVCLLLDLATIRSRRDPHQLELLLLRHEVRVLRRQLKRVAWRPGHRLLLAALSRALPRSAWGVFPVRPETLLRWHRELVRRKWAAFGRRRGPGRPPVSAECRHLILRLATENPRWGYQRVRGELLKLGHPVSATTIRALLKRHGQGPHRARVGPSWREFLRAHAQALLACDFFTVETVRLKVVYVLFFIELASRRVFVVGSTKHPTSAWVTQQARNLAWEIEEGFQPRFLIHDRDKKYVMAFDQVFAAEGVQIVRTPLRAPRANAYAERWVGTVRRECLDWLLILSPRHLEEVLRVYVSHYNTQRPHRGLGLGSPVPATAPFPVSGSVARRDLLGGVLHEYSRIAA